MYVKTVELSNMMFYNKILAKDRLFSVYNLCTYYFNYCKLLYYICFTNVLLECL